MAYRFTNTEKWTDKWFSSLTQIQMLLFIYLCDNCDIAGFIEVNYKRWASDLNSSVETIEGACKGLARGLIYSESMECIYIKNFLKHQKNLPLNKANKAHLGILKRFDLYSDIFKIDDINNFIEGACKGLQSPLGIGNGIGNGKIPEKINWKNDFETYKYDLNKSFEEIKKDTEWILKQEKFNPNVDIILSIEKAIYNFWGKEAGWKNKKSSKTTIIDWKATFANAINLNKVYKQKIQTQEENQPMTYKPKLNG